MIIPESCANCKLTLETIDGCIDCLRVKAGLPKQKWVHLSSLQKRIKDCKDEILEFHLEDDKHTFSDLIEYVSYRAGQINAIIDKHFSDVFSWAERDESQKEEKKL